MREARLHAIFFAEASRCRRQVGFAVSLASTGKTQPFWYLAGPVTISNVSSRLSSVTTEPQGRDPTSLKSESAVSGTDCRPRATAFNKLADIGTVF